MDFLSNPQFWTGWVRIAIFGLLHAGGNALVPSAGGAAVARRVRR